MKMKMAEAEGFCMNTGIAYRVFGEHARIAVEEAQRELLRLEGILSRFQPDSEVAAINRNSGKDCVKISAGIIEILSLAILLSEISSGRFDITVGPLIDLWDYKHSTQVPKEESIQRTLPLVDFKKIRLNSQEKTVRLGRQGQSIDLGGIGKGYASDRCISLLQKYGVTSAFINIGGNVSTLGNRPDGTAWCVGIRHPRQNGCLLGAVNVTGKAVVTSGDYERFFIDRDGKRQHHILNPRTGYPAESGLISVTVIAESAMIADALSTAIFVAGLEMGIGYLAHFPGTEAVLVDKDQRVFITQGLKKSFLAAEGVVFSTTGKEQVI